MKSKNFLILGLFCIIFINGVSAYVGGGGGGYIVPCEDWCNNSKPYETYCNENNQCVFDVEDRDEYMLSFNGECSEYFDLSSDEYDECWNWWMDYYDRESLRNLDKANRNLTITIFIMCLIVILKLIEIFTSIKSEAKNEKN